MSSWARALTVAVAVGLSGVAAAQDEQPREAGKVEDRVRGEAENRDQRVRESAEVEGAEVEGAEVEGAEVEGAEVEGAEVEGAEVERVRTVETIVEVERVVNGPGRLEQGRQVYVRYCATCHGLAGDGDGPSARYLDVAPRDFTSGLFKFRSTQPGTPPADSDLARTIREGIPLTSMPAWGNTLSTDEVDAVVAYVEAFSDRFEGAGEPDFIEITPMPALDEATAQAGMGLFTGLCASCHGAEGRGDGAAGLELVDDWGNPIKPRDLTKGVYKSGYESPVSLFRTLSTGIEGTPMAPWVALPADKRWELVAYVLSLREDQGYLVGDVPAGRYPEFPTIE